MNQMDIAGYELFQMVVVRFADKYPARALYIDEKYYLHIDGTVQFNIYDYTELGCYHALINLLED